VEREVLRFIRSQVFTARDFVIDSKGVCRLHPELAKAVSGFAVSEVLLRESVRSAGGRFSHH
jgi:hypothetical protein